MACNQRAREVRGFPNFLCNGNRVACVWYSVEMMDTGKADMVESISRAAGPQGDPGSVAVPEASESALQVIFLPPLKAEDAQAEGCNV